jgi:hypothetical protein
MGAAGAKKAVFCASPVAVDRPFDSGIITWKASWSVDGARMPSIAVQRWFAERAVTLEEVENAHRFVHGSGPGARAATQKINQDYAVLLSAQLTALPEESLEPI